MILLLALPQIILALVVAIGASFAVPRSNAGGSCPPPPPAPRGHPMTVATTRCVAVPRTQVVTRHDHRGRPYQVQKAAVRAQASVRD